MLVLLSLQMLQSEEMAMPVNMNKNEEVTTESVDPAREKCTEEWNQSGRKQAEKRQKGIR